VSFLGNPYIGRIILNCIEIKKNINDGLKNIYDTKMDGNEYNIKFFDKSIRYREWNISINIIIETIKWFIKNRTGLHIDEETDLCEFCLRKSYLWIKRKDVYTLIGYSLPLVVLDYLVENKERWVHNK